MKRIANITTIVLLTCGLFFTAHAQDQKIGYIDSEYILQKIPEYKGIQQQLDVVSQGWRDDIKELEDEIEQLRKEFEAKKILYTDEVREQKKNEIEQKVQQKKKLVDQKFGPEGEYFQKQQELLNPIQRRVMEAVTAVAEQEGFDYVFDRSGEYSFLYTRPEWDISDKVLIELGINVDQVSN